MNWLDIAFAAPVIGVTCEPRLQFPHEMLDDLRPALETWKQTHPNILFIIPAPPTALIQLKIGDGFVCDILGNAVNTSFKYEAKVVDVPAGLPRITNQELLKFSDLMTRAVDVTATVCDRLTRPPIQLTRLGIVADCRLDGKALPPGIVKLLAHVGKPWGTPSPLVFSGALTCDLPPDDKWDYRCTHVFDVNSIERPADVRVRLDWQMSPREGSHLLAKGAARSFIQDASRRADKYFESFGAGGLHYAAS